MTENDLAQFIYEDEGLRRFIQYRMSVRLRPFLDVDDILQQVFLSANRMLPAYQDRDEVLIRSWLRGVAVHRIIDAARARASRPCINQGELQPHERGAEPNRAPERTPSSVVAAIEARERVIAALEGLPVKQKEVVQLYALQGEHQTDVAQRLKIGRKLVRSHMTIAKTNLRRLLGSQKRT